MEKGQTYSNQLILGTSCEISSIRTEANTSDIQISNRVNRLILQNANLLSSNNVEDLGRSVAASRDIFSVVTEANTAHDTLMMESVDKINIKNTRHTWIEDRKPILFNLLLVGRQALKVQLCKRISDADGTENSRTGISDQRHLRRGSRVWVRHRLA